MTILDRLGISASVLCAVHCAALPLLGFLGVSLFGLGESEEMVHTYFLIGTLVFACITFAIGSLKHRDPHSWKWVFFAFVTMAVSIMFHDWFDQNAWLHAVPMVLFGVFLVTAHVVNLRAWHAHRGSSSCGCRNHH